MKRSIVYGGIAGLLSAAHGMANVPANPADTCRELRVVVTALKSDRGTVRFNLYGSESDYREQGGAFLSDNIAIRNKTSVWVVRDLPRGDYALIIYHDENNNRRFDTNFMGLPVESFGFSNNVRPKLSLPAFAEVKFSVKETATRLTIQAQ